MDGKKILLPVIITIAALLRLAAVLKYGNFWDDEMFNFTYSQKPWPEGLVYWLWETNPPLHLFVLKIWFFIVPATEFFARLPSVIAGTATVYFIYRLGCAMFYKNIGLIAALYLALHPYHIFWSATARVYSLLMLLATVSIYIFCKIYFLEEKNKKIFIRCSAAINLLLILSHLTSVFIIGAQCLTLLISGKIKEFKHWFKINLPAFLIGFGWIAASIIIKRQNNLSSAWFFNLKQDFSSFSHPISNLFSGQYPLFLAIIAMFFGFIVIGTAIGRRVAVEKNTFFLSLALFSLLPIIFSFALGVWHVKFTMVILPIFVLLFAASLRTFLSPKLTAILLTIFCLPGLLTLFFKTMPLSDWQRIENFYQAHKFGSTALVYNNFILQPQIERYMPKISNQAIFLPLYQGLTYDEMVVKKNYLYVVIDEAYKDKWYQDQKLSSYDTLILLQGENSYTHKLDDFLSEKGWLVEGAPERARICGPYYLYVLKKSSGTP